MPNTAIAKRSLSLPAAPFSVQPSGNFLGNDGLWSTFFLNAGSPPQQFQVIVSTSSPSLWLINWNVCDPTADYTVALHPNCIASRGNGWYRNNSTSYSLVGLYNVSVNDVLKLPAAYGQSPVAKLYPGSDYNSGSVVGVDRVGLLNASSLEGPLNVGRALIYDLIDRSFWVGSLGIGLTDFATQDNTTFASLLGNLSSAAAIPGNSWGYTAGAHYLNSTANLVFGGYDSTRMKEPVPDFSMVNLQAGNSSLEIQVSVEVITISNDTHSVQVTNSVNTGFKAVIDSTLPYLYLPPSVCDAFAEMVGLQYDNGTELYTINATQRAAMADKTIEFLVTDATKGLTTSKNIALPYAAFDLNATWPVYDNATSYFPIRRSPSEDSNALHIIGRTFLQEAYIIADYDRGNFTIANAVPGGSEAGNIIAIMKPAATSRKLNAGKVAGIVVGIVVPILLLVILFFRWRKRSRKPEVPEKDNTTVGQSDQIESWRSGTLSNTTVADQSHELSPETMRHELRGSMIRPYNEVEDKSDATTWALNQQRQSHLSSNPSELQGDFPGGYVRSSTPSYVALGSSPNSMTTFGTSPNPHSSFSPPTSPNPQIAAEHPVHEESIVQEEPLEGTDDAEMVGAAEVTSATEQRHGIDAAEVEVGGTLEPGPAAHISRYERIRRMFSNSSSNTAGRSPLDTR